jgi:hypothetical protein
LEKSLDTINEDKSNENEEITGIDKTPKSYSEIYSKFRLFKLIKIVLYYGFNTIKKNKLLFTILMLFCGYFLKNEVQRMFERVLSIVKFK